MKKFLEWVNEAELPVATIPKLPVAKIIQSQNTQPPFAKVAPEQTNIDRNMVALRSTIAMSVTKIREVRSGILRTANSRSPASVEEQTVWFRKLNEILKFIRNRHPDVYEKARRP